MNTTLDPAYYVFDPSSQTIEFLGDMFEISRLKLITNTATQEIIYNFADPAAGNGGVSGNLLSLLYDTTSMNASDPLAVIIDLADDPEDFTRVGGIDPNGHKVGLRVNPRGHVVPSDQEIVQGSRSVAATIWMVETTGYNSIVVQMTGTWAGTQTFEISNDSTTWSSVAGWAVAGAATPVTTTTANGHWVFPCVGRYFRVRFSTYSSGNAVAIGVLKNQPAFYPASSPNIAANSSININQIGAGAIVAEDSASTANPLIIGGVVRTALPAATVVAGDAVRSTFSRSGQLVFKQFAPGDLDFIVNTTVTTATQTAIRAAQGTDIRQNVTQITYQNTNSTATTLTIQDASTTLIAISVPASMTLAQQLTFPTPLRGTANAALNYTAGTTAASILLNVTGFNSY
jgi:hypothetical protein